MSWSAIHRLYYPPLSLAGLPAIIKTARSRLNFVNKTFITLQHSSSKPNLNNRPDGTYYDLFPKTFALGPPPTGTFNIDLVALRQEFLKLQAQAHPDRHANTSKESAGHESTLINEAFAVLKSPLSRAQYLLSLRQSNIKEEEINRSIAESDILSKVMNIRERIDAARSCSIATLGKLKNEIEQNVKQSETQVAKAFDNDDLQAAKRQTIFLQYWMSVKSSFDELEFPLR
ncbi:J-type co-chaperone, mitochondrial [Erysiphe necator]|uniref:Putative j-type co-chaperone mitochondrial n=1 Tax=Uncinula necator TaxID=52586 RepID=A0A0B1P9M8_UNCNE|nr:J-type co-chaperone, mitochondrial [Erysiphe necator]KHJ33339.1 putative j-type co-chaperone mitochondrial [Erysiphe necator]